LKETGVAIVIVISVVLNESLLRQIEENTVTFTTNNYFNATRKAKSGVAISTSKEIPENNMG